MIKKLNSIFPADHDEAGWHFLAMIHRVMPDHHRFFRRIISSKYKY